MNSHIPTLLLREWMQHKRGWLITAFAPPLLFLALLPFGQLQGLPTEHLDLIALVICVVSASTVYAISLAIASFQIPGLARRDVQDRSIEFWLSLPGRPSESVAATLLAHLWLVPVGAMLVGGLFALPIAMAVLGLKASAGALASVNWGEVLAYALPTLVRGLAGTLLLSLTLLPLLLPLMAASAWLKRLGVPLLLVGTGVAVAVMYKVYEIAWPVQALQWLVERGDAALLFDPRGAMDALKAGDNPWLWLAQDFGQALMGFVSPITLGWAAVAAASFWLVVRKRAHAG